MHRRGRPSWRRAVVGLVAAGTCAAVGAGYSTAAGAAAAVGTTTTASTTTTARTATTIVAGSRQGTRRSTSVSGTIRTIRRGATLAAPTGTTVDRPTGVRTPEIAQEPRDEGGDHGGRAATDRGAAHSGSDRTTDRSLSRRPTAMSSFAAAPLEPPTVRSSRVRGPGGGLLRSFEGLNSLDQRSANGGNQFSVEPPDQALCVGNGFTLEAVNDVLRVYRASGAPVTGVTDLNTFYGYPAQIDRAHGIQGPFVTDPTCIFDHGTGRFFLVVLTLEVNPTTGDFLGPNHLDLAVSRTGDPTGRWDVYRLPVQDDGTQGTPRHADCPCIGDYPHIGSDRNAVFVTTNEYPFTSDPGEFGNNFNGAQIYALDKRALVTGAAGVTVVHFENTFLPSGTARVPGFTVWPAQVPGTRYDNRRDGTEHLLSSVAGAEAQPTAPTGTAAQIGVWTVTRTGTIRSNHPRLLLDRSLVRSQVYAVPPRSDQKPGPVPLRDCIAVNCHDVLGQGAPPRPGEDEGPLDSNDSRMQQVYYSGGQVFGALDTAVRVGGELRAGIAWFAVRPGRSTNRSVVTGRGYVAIAGNNVIYPALAVQPDRSGVMAFTLVGRDHFPSAAFSRFSPSGTGPVRVAAEGRAPQDGFSEYDAFAAPGTPARPRWGDYGAAVTDGFSVVLASEYIQSQCTFAQFNADLTCGGTRAPLTNWSTRVSRVRTP